MTNGEMIQSIFPNMNFGTLAQDDVIVNRDYSNNDEPQVFIPKRVWNAEYKEPTTKNDLGDDCISRADAIQAMQDKAKKLKNEDTINGLCGAVAILFELPSVTPQEPKTGYWISTETKGVRYAFWCRYKCSLCGGLSDCTNFCPNCGARMVEPQESEDKESAHEENN